ncbi:thioredoxin domain-containing protein [Pusillimonas caeni]|uniref:thioredoxin domain-containing protein n=1 Tax=Pusillimonas caeni TaxID=1348472 RepID=UPI000E59EF93|nr:thioredoxin domain-containing protein [Pusillimonas caeni]TFL10149.1 thioredoxin domain-containing protein [Pusillimonas caeni]
MPNHLSDQTSPYLLQHADNPVDWHPWNAEALALARSTNRPILLSVGYSACHWCHVMAHECFENEETAELMNRGFVNVKVDREERPDIDHIYQLAHQLIVGRGGGWPLTMFLTPTGEPFFGGTYFPKHARYGRPGFDEVLKRVTEVWSTQRDQVLAEGAQRTRRLAELARGFAQGEAADVSSEAMLAETATASAQGLRDVMMQAFDAVHGGFGVAPKFPQPAILSALLRHAVAQRDDQARDAVLTTLRQMAEGGLYDHLGGGFFRYSTDERWEIPHFEKMLYDNGPLLRLYAEAWQVSGDPIFALVCEETAAWLMREMQAAEGGFFSSIDADSEGEEGKFYVWQREEAAQALDASSWPVVAAYYGFDTSPNFEDQAWHLRVVRPLAQVARDLGRPEMTCAAQIAQARPRLLARRERRVRPARDEKILTSWNALAIDGMAFAARVFSRPAWAASARRAYDFLRATLWRDGRLLVTYKDGRAHSNAYLDDYAFLLGASLEVLQGDTLDGDDLQFARALADTLLTHFEDRTAGGFFFTSNDHEALVVRPKSGDDGALASGNAVAAVQLQRLGHLVGEPRYLEAAQRAMSSFASQARRLPQAFGTLSVALAEWVTPPYLLALTGMFAETSGCHEQLAGRYLPHVMTIRLPAQRQALPAVLRMPSEPASAAWVCRGATCLPPVSDPDVLPALLALPDARA